MDSSKLLEKVATLDPQITPEEKANCPAVKIPSEILLNMAKSLKEDLSLGFDLLLSHTVVHWNEENEFELLYRLYSTQNKHHILVTTKIPVSNPLVSSVSSVWQIAEWQEREAYDLFGVLYGGHPDLRRLLLEDDWKGFPLRKDYKDDFMLEGP